MLSRKKQLGLLLLASAAAGSLLGCPKHKIPKLKDKSVALGGSSPTNPAFAREPLCIDKKPPVLTATAEHGFKLLLCGTPDPLSHARLDGVKVMNYFMVYAVGDPKETGVVFISPSESEKYEVQLVAKGLRVTKTLATATGPLLPVFAFDITCGVDGCQKGPEVCRLALKKAPPVTVLSRLDKELHKRKPSSPRLIGLFKEATRLALSGNKKAIAFFKQGHQKEKNIPFTGPVSFAYSQGLDLIIHAKELGCLKGKTHEKQ